MADTGTGKSSGKGSGRAVAIVGWGMAVLAALLGGLVLGALVLFATSRIAWPGARLGLAAAAAAIAALGVPLLLDRKITQAYRRLDATAASTSKQTLGIWNGLLLALAVLAFPATTRAALTRHGHWLLGGTADGPTTALGRAIGRAAGYIPRSGDEPSMVALPTASPSASALGTGPSATIAPSAAAPTTPSNAARPDEPLPVPDHDLSPQEVFRLRADAVVVIATRQRIDKKDPLYELYRELGLAAIDGFGSGFVLEPAGLIVTNHHVVEGAESLQVTLRSGTEYPSVEVLALDREHDLALLGIQAKDLPTAPLAPDDAPSAGARAIAIGSPLGLEYSVTDGIVSAVRNIQGTSFLQMETTIAPGSSGGPLFDVRGRVMGVNTATRGDGLNLAVHVKYVRGLLGLPRKPTKLATHVAGARIAELTVEGADASAVERMQFEDALRLLSVGLDSCVKTAPADPYLTVSFEEPSDRSPMPTPGAVDSNLSDEAQGCLKNNLRLTSHMLGMIMAEAFGAPLASGKTVALVVRVSGLQASETPDGGPRALSMTVRFQMGGRRTTVRDGG